MKEKQHSIEESSQVLYLMPKAVLEQILESQQKILRILEGNSSQNIGDYLSEEEVKKILGKKTTWLWRMRHFGKLGYTKVGGKVFYFKGDIEKLMKMGRKEAFDK